MKCPSKAGRIRREKHQLSHLFLLNEARRFLLQDACIDPTATSISRCACAEIAFFAGNSTMVHLSDRPGRSPSDDQNMCWGRHIR